MYFQELDDENIDASGVMAIEDDDAKIEEIIRRVMAEVKADPAISLASANQKPGARRIIGGMLRGGLQGMAMPGTGNTGMDIARAALAGMDDYDDQDELQYNMRTKRMQELERLQAKQEANALNKIRAEAYGIRSRAQASYYKKREEELGKAKPKRQPVVLPNGVMYDIDTGQYMQVPDHMRKPEEPEEVKTDKTVVRNPDGSEQSTVMSSFLPSELGTYHRLKPDMDEFQRSMEQTDNPIQRMLGLTMPQLRNPIREVTRTAPTKTIQQLALDNAPKTTANAIAKAVGIAEGTKDIHVRPGGGYRPPQETPTSTRDAAMEAYIGELETTPGLSGNLVAMLAAARADRPDTPHKKAVLGKVIKELERRLLASETPAQTRKRQRDEKNAAEIAAQSGGAARGGGATRGGGGSPAAIPKVSAEEIKKRLKLNY